MIATPLPRQTGWRVMTLAPREEALVDALEAQGYAITQEIPGAVLEQAAEELGVKPGTASGMLCQARKRWGVDAQRDVGYVRTGLLPEAPALPLGCTDPAVIARCQQWRR